MQQRIQADNQKTDQEQARYDALFDAVSDSLEKNVATIKQGFQDIKTTLANTQFKVKISAGLPTINSVRL